MPLVAFEPVQPPEAVQLVELVAVQFRVDALPVTTALGVAPSVTAGGGSMAATLTDWLALPPGPVQLRVKVVATFSAPVD